MNIYTYSLSFVFSFETFSATVYLCPILLWKCTMSGNFCYSYIVWLKEWILISITAINIGHMIYHMIQYYVLHCRWICWRHSVSWWSLHFYLHIPQHLGCSTQQHSTILSGHQRRWKQWDNLLGRYCLMYIRWLFCMGTDVWYFCGLAQKCKIFYLICTIEH